MKELFEYTDYKAYLRDQIAAQPKGGHGVRSRLAQAMGSPVSQVSRVLGADIDFTLEQAEAVNDFLAHNPEESDYFLLLVQRARAGTPGLRRRVDQQLRAIIDRRLVMKERFQAKASVSREDQGVFYSSWIYATVHILLTIPQFQTKEALARRLQVPLKRVGEVLDFLVSVGLAVQEGTRYRTGTTDLYLGSDSPFIAKHHSNWRLRAIQSFDGTHATQDLHYSSAVTISRADFERLKAQLIKDIDRVRAVVKDSPEEDLYSFCVDLFAV